MPNGDWSDLGAGQRVAVAAGMVLQLSLLVGALVDLYRRPAARVRGRKVLWVAVSFINFVGPISYFLFGRRR